MLDLRASRGQSVFPLGTIDIEESQSDGRLRLTVRGELDLASVPRLERRLAQLRGRRTPAVLDLSELQFIDATGIDLLVRTVGDARMKGWRLDVNRAAAPQVTRLLRLLRLEDFVFSPAPS